LHLQVTYWTGFPFGKSVTASNFSSVSTARPNTADMSCVVSSVPFPNRSTSVKERPSYCKGVDGLSLPSNRQRLPRVPIAMAIRCGRGAQALIIGSDML
jgi:hypothetical protein